MNNTDTPLRDARRTIKALWGAVVILAVLCGCLLVRAGNADDVQIIDVRTDYHGYNTVTVRKVDTIVYSDIPDSMLNRLISHIDEVSNIDTTAD